MQKALVSGLLSLGLAVGLVVSAPTVKPAEAMIWSCTELTTLASNALSRGDLAAYSRYTQQARSCRTTGVGAAVASSLTGCNFYNSRITSALSSGNLADAARWRAALNDCRINTTNLLNATAPAPAPTTTQPVAPPSGSNSTNAPDLNNANPGAQPSGPGSVAEPLVAYITISAPSSAVAGSTIEIIATFWGPDGRPVEVTNSTTSESSQRVDFTYSGPGIVACCLPNATNRNGQARFFVTFGNNDRGTATVTYDYTLGWADGRAPYQVRASAVIQLEPDEVARPDPGQPRAWTRATGPHEIKLYARDLVGAGKVTFYHNGNEVAWIRAVDATDPKLNVASDGMVRTRALVSGRNVFEIYVDGERIVRRIATGS